MARVAIDAEGDPLSISRGLLRALTEAMAGQEPESGPYIKLSAEARQVTKLVEALERERAGEETPEDRERRLRREDGVVRREILQYVEQAERQAAQPGEGAPFGRCVHCGHALPEGGVA